MRTHSLSLSLSLPVSFEVKNMAVGNLNIIYMCLVKKKSFDLSYILFLPPPKYRHLDTQQIIQVHDILGGKIVLL